MAAADKPKATECRVCGRSLEGLERRGRRVYCSPSCAREGSKQKSSDYQARAKEARLQKEREAHEGLSRQLQQNRDHRMSLAAWYVERLAADPNRPEDWAALLVQMVLRVLRLGKPTQDVVEKYGSPER